MNLDRRDFLIRSSALVFSGAQVLTRGRTEAAAVRVAVVGTGSRGTDLVRKLSTIDRARIVAVCDDYRPHLERGLAAAGAQAEAYASYARMLSEADPEAVVIATPLDRHFDMAMEAVEAGRAVYCEKTMCYSVDQARRLAEAVRARGVVFQVGLQRRANAIYRQAAAMVETGMLGRVTAITCRWHRNGSWRRPVPVGRDDPAWPDLERRLNWRLYRDTSHGLMTELGSHQLDVATWLLGTPPRRAIGSGGIDHWRDGREVFDNVFCIYEYGVPTPEGEAPYTARVTFSSIQTNAYEGASELVMGTRGTLLLTQKKGLFYREARSDEPVAEAGGRVERSAALVTSGKSLQMANDPWAHRGRPYEMDTDSDDTRNALLSFIEHVQAADPATVCPAATGLENTAAALLPTF